MYYVSKTQGLVWSEAPPALVPLSPPSPPKPGWDGLGLQLRWNCLLKRTQLLCEPQPEWFSQTGLAPRSPRAQQTVWNTIAELMLLGVLENGYLAFVSPSNAQGFKLELIGWLDTLKMLVVEDGGLIWDLYRERDELPQPAPVGSGDAPVPYGGSGSGGHYGPDGQEFGGEGMLKLSETATLVRSGYYYPDADNSELLEEGRRLRHQLRGLLEGCR